jgi:hypothetical protein
VQVHTFMEFGVGLHVYQFGVEEGSSTPRRVRCDLLGVFRWLQLALPHTVNSGSNLLGVLQGVGGGLSL